MPPVVSEVGKTMSVAMPGFQNILFPIDFSERCRAISPNVEALALHFDAHLTLIHVVNEMDMPPAEAETRTRLEQFLDVFTQPFRTPKLAVEHGDPATRIVDYANAHNIDLIMMPTRGAGKLRALLLGSVTAKVLHDAKCAVWTASPSECPELCEAREVRNILCALDAEPESTEISLVLLRAAMDFAELHRARLRIVHAIPGAKPLCQPGEPNAFDSYLFETARNGLSMLQRNAGSNLEVSIGGGRVSKVVHDAALQHQSDLIVIGRGRQSKVLGRLRGHAYSIIRDAPRPVLSL